MAGRWDGRRALVTGASSGVGREIARGLAADGARVLLPVRDRGRGEAAARSIRDSVPDAALEVRDLDLADFGSVSALAAELRDEGEPIDLLVLNAGIILLGDKRRHETVDGHELHLQTNFLGHAVLTQGLLPVLGDGARIAVQLSLAVPFGRLGDLECRRGYSAFKAYAGSKRALGLWAAEFARRTPRVHVGLCHPGVAPDTGIAADLRAKLHDTGEGGMARRLGGTPIEAARPALTALATDAADGRLFVPGGLFGVSGVPRERKVWRALRGARAGERVWGMVEAVVGVGAR